MCPYLWGQQYNPRSASYTVKVTSRSHLVHSNMCGSEQSQFSMRNPILYSVSCEICNFIQFIYRQFTLISKDRIQDNTLNVHILNHHKIGNFFFIHYSMLGSKGDSHQILILQWGKCLILVDALREEVEVT